MADTHTLPDDPVYAFTPAYELTDELQQIPHRLRRNGRLCAHCIGSAEPRRRGTALRSTQRTPRSESRRLVRHRRAVHGGRPQQRPTALTLAHWPRSDRPIQSLKDTNHHETNTQTPQAAPAGGHPSCDPRAYRRNHRRRIRRQPPPRVQRRDLARPRRRAPSTAARATTAPTTATRSRSRRKSSTPCAAASMAPTRAASFDPRKKPTSSTSSRSPRRTTAACARPAPACASRFASDLLNLTLAAPEVNRCTGRGKCAFDAAEWLPPMNRCWFAARVVAVKRKYDLSVDRREAAALEHVLSRCTSTEMVFTRSRRPDRIPADAALRRLRCIAFV